MLAPPQKRAANRRDKRRQRAREKQDLHRTVLWLSGRAVAGLIQQLVHNGQLSDEQAHDYRNVERALAQALEAQGRNWPT
jgi:hypothetical protein